MPQLSLYLDDSTMDMLRDSASAQSVSLSKYASKIIRARAEASAWPEGFWDLYGALADETFTAPGELDFALDSARAGW